MNYVIAFIIGGAICVIGELIYDYTKLTPAHILVLFTVIGALLEGVGVYQPLLDFGGAGALVPVSGFGASITRGVLAEIQTLGWEGLFTGVFEITGLGLATAMIFGFLAAVITSPKG